FGFSSVAGLVFLSLLPAIRRRAGYVDNNGSPWRWPLYPWVLFGVLAAAVPAGGWLLCWSMHLLSGGDSQRLIFGPYFAVPFGFAVAVLLLEIGIAPHPRPLSPQAGRGGKGRGVAAVALAAPALLGFLAGVGHRDDQSGRAHGRT